MLLLRALILALPAAAAVFTADADAEVAGCQSPTAAVPADCSRREIRQCARAEAAGASKLAKRCQLESASRNQRRRRRPPPNWCRCCTRLRDACQQRTGEGAVGTRRQLRKRLRRLVRRLGAGSDSQRRRRPATRRETMLERLLDLELRLLKLRKVKRKSAGRRANNATSGDIFPRITKKSSDDDNSWAPDSLEQRYFVDTPAASSDSVGANFLGNTTAEVSGSFTLAWLTHLEEQRTAKVKAACHRVSCNRAKGELCLTNIQDLPVCRCVTNVNCLNERRRLRRQRVGLSRTRRQRRQHLTKKSTKKSKRRRALTKLAKQFAGRVCAQLSGLPAERTYPSRCHMQAAACASDSQVLRLSDGACANHDLESEALETLTDQKCAKCLARNWRGRGCKKWRRKCQRPPVLASSEF